VTNRASILDELADFRAVARYVCRHLDGEARSTALCRLFTRAKGAALPALVVRVICAEVAYDQTEPVVDSVTPIEVAIRELRRRGCSSCPTCRQGLPDGATLAYWHRLAERAIDEAAIREAAAMSQEVSR
jgi:hypothetical protein